ncbi:hypothetical protein WOLCODRAFT_27624 [Wolfiporia cocos MD-104 SS10]|uniref:Uncharacterized protein n=1 Tax=Wolfiporia cocos (strain MD-104) TaxID=742152 RepID=A0A2H3IYK1_WOLCO|nr:hypothetical protein WOLCODRAFT_27624 [Wolfiporia cocos MD-104 SS10]
MPSFTFLPQPSPLVPAPDGSSNNPTSAAHGPAPSHAYAMLHGHGHGHAMSPFTPFSPGVTMSPGAFWGHPGSGAVNPLINPAVGAPVHAGSPGGYYWPRASEESQGYFPPVPVSMAMAQGNAQAAAPGQEGYFPVVPSGGGGPMSTGTTRPSGLANELRRGDSHGSQEGTSVGGDVDERAGAEQPRSKSSNSEATTGTGTGTWTEADASPRPASSQATSWHTDGERERAEPGSQELTQGIDALAVADGDGAAAPESGSGKPRAYSADCSPPQSTPAQLQRADSDPARRTVPDADANATRIGLGIDMLSADRST